MSPHKDLAIPILLFASFVYSGCDSDENTRAKDFAHPNALDSEWEDPSASLHTTDREFLEVSDQERNQVQSDVRRMLRAVYSEDVDTVLDHTHPKAIELMGGREQAERVTAKALSQLQAAGMAVESVSFPNAPTFLAGSRHEFVIVPTKSVITASGQRVESLNYQFGARARGSDDWKYIEGSRISQENVRSLFSDFPVGYRFPATYRRKL